MTMEAIIDETLSNAEIERFEDIYNTSRRDGGSDLTQATFQYGYALVRSKRNQDIKRGVSMLETLYQEGDQVARRDYLYYMAVGHARLNQYPQALDCLDRFLEEEPQNSQAHQLRKSVKERLTKDGLLGIAITSGVALAVAGLLGVVMSRAKK